MKKIGVIGIFLILVVLPGISWFYMQSGVNFRKQAFAEMTEQGDIDTSLLTKANLDKTKDKIVLISMSGSKQTIDSILSQYGKIVDFSILQQNGIDSLSMDTTLLDKMKERYNNADFLLIDEMRKIRGTYKDKDEDRKLLVKHIAILLPFVEKNKRYNAK